MSEPTPPPPPPGWFDDPEMVNTLRYWNGSAWTEHRSPKPATAAPTPAPAPSPSRNDATTSTWMILAGGGISVVSAFLPWASLGPFSVAGTEGDGQISLALGAVVVALGLLRLTRGSGKAAAVITAVLGLCILGVGGYQQNNLGDAADVGVYGTIAGGVLTIVGGMISRKYPNDKPEERMTSRQAGDALKGSDQDGRPPHA